MEPKTLIEKQLYAAKIQLKRIQEGSYSKMDLNYGEKKKIIADLNQLIENLTNKLKDIDNDKI